MLRHLLRFGVGVGLLFALTAPAPAADPPPKNAAPRAAAAADDAHQRRRLPPVLQEAGNDRGILDSPSNTKSKSAASTSPPA